MSLPRLASFDNTLAFFRAGYDFVGNRCRETGSDAFRTRIMLRKVVCMRGAEAARQFYDGEHFTRAGSMPLTTLRLLQDKGSVQQYDGAHHRARKAMFLRLLTGSAVDAILEKFEYAWHDAFPDWCAQPSVVLHEEMQRLLCKAACAWAGVSLSDQELSRRTHEMAAMIGSAGAVSPKVLRALLLRRRSEAWARRAILRARRQEKTDTPVSVLAHHREPDGNLLDTASAAEELLNLIRPTVAVARFITFAALALHEHPDAAEWLEEDPEERMAAFVDEVRRFYPFFPVIGGRVRHPFDWRGHRFVKDDWVLLGLHATNHDPALWGDPQAFRPARFERREPSAFDLVPQGAGDHAKDHRCPGEWFTTALIGRALRLLKQARWGLPQQDLSISLGRFPTLPATGLVVVFARGRESVALGACNENTAVGNDREAQLEPAPVPAAIVQAGPALANVATGMIKPETMSDADIQALGGRRGRCAVVLTEVAFPSFLYVPDGPGAIKLNGKLIILPQTEVGRFAAGGLIVILQPVDDEEGDAGLQAMEMIVVPPEAEDEIGYSGYVQCFDGEEP